MSKPVSKLYREFSFGNDSNAKNAYDGKKIPEKNQSLVNKFWDEAGKEDLENLQS